jgi:uroporphyrinogen decarboxylase
MEEMTQRERTLACFNFEPADRMCLDGSFRPEVWEMLEHPFNTEDRGVIVRELGIGFMSGVNRKPNPEWLERSEETDHGRAIVHEDGTLESEWGVRMEWGKDGKYERYVYNPLADPENFKTYTMPPIDNPALWEGCREKVEESKKVNVVRASIPTFYRWGWELRGMENFLCDIAAESKELIMILDMLEEHHVELARRYGELGVDVIGLWGDLAMQTTTLMHPDAWKKHFKPRTARVIDTARTNGVKYIYLHSDGNNTPIMDDLVEIGLNILDPVQPECMDPTEVREKYPDLVMHGTISSQRTLPFGTVEDVRNEVLDRIAKCGRKNGLAIAPNNVVQPDVSVEKLLCVYETVKEVGPGFWKKDT